MKLDAKTLESEVRNLLIKMDDEINKLFEDDDGFKSTYNKDAMIRFEDDKQENYMMVNFYYDGDVYDLLDQYNDTKFAKDFRQLVENNGWEYEYYSSSVIQVYQHPKRGRR